MIIFKSYSITWAYNMAVQELLRTDEKHQFKANIIEETQFVLDFSGVIDFTDDQLFKFCAVNRDLRIERTGEGKLIIMAPMGGKGSKRESVIISRLFIWNEKHKLGEVFSSNGGFILSNGAMLSPDASFITNERWESLTDEDQDSFIPLCPDFLAELRSKSDRLKDLKAKMNEWMENGCRLGWLIDPLEEKAYIYRPNKEIEIVDTFDKKLSGEDLLPGFELDLSEFREQM